MYLHVISTFMQRVYETKRAGKSFAWVYLIFYYYYSSFVHEPQTHHLCTFDNSSLGVPHKTQMMPITIVCRCATFPLDNNEILRN
jgi:hypothetical protein